MYQPDLFKLYTRNESTRQTRYNPTSYNNNIQSQNPVITQKNQPTQIQISIPLSDYSQQHEITKTQLKNFFQNQMPQNYYR